MFKNQGKFIDLKKWMVKNYYAIRKRFLPQEQALKFLEMVRDYRGHSFIQETFDIYQELEHLGHEEFCKAVEEYDFEGFK
tara:strand:+ start:5768 stop:6007 length:240 start_codon:yes stop_codon:yes gene_type:complete